MERDDKVSLQENTIGLHGVTSSAAVFKMGHTMITSHLHRISLRIKHVMRNTVKRLWLSVMLIYGRHGEEGTWH
jgi:hypothetical protein